MKLEVGMYVRTDLGIDKIKDIILIGNLYEDSGLYLEKNRKIICGKEVMKQLKASHNIIDLIERGDYVNGDLVLFAGATTWDNEGNVLVKQVHINHNGYDWWIKEDFIKSIVTKEQFESMSYKVGD